MTLETGHVSVLLRAIALLLMLLGAPARAWRRFIDWSDAKLTRLEWVLEYRLRCGLMMRYAGEDEATAEKRLKIIAWFADNPAKATRHLARLARAGYPIFRTQGYGLRFAAPAGLPASDAPPAGAGSQECPGDDTS